MALAASRSNTREKAIEYIDLAIQIANSCFLQTMDFSIYKEFVVVRSYNIQLNVMCAQPRFCVDFRVEPAVIVAHRKEV
jgi:ribosomal protein S26